MVKEADLADVAQELLQVAGPCRVWTFAGELGAGKTTLIRALCTQLGVPAAEVTSPTFALINEYQANHTKTVYHMDLYRLQSLEEALDIGVEDYFYSGSYCFVEWPEVVAPILPEGTMTIKLEITGDSMRKILF